MTQAEHPSPEDEAADPVTRRALLAGAGAAAIVGLTQTATGAWRGTAPRPTAATPALPPRMRGLNLELAPGSLSPSIARELAAWGVNTVRINFSTDISTGTATDGLALKPGRADPLAPYRNNLAALKRFTSECRQLGVGVVLAANGIFQRDRVNLDDFTGASFRTHIRPSLMQFWTAMAEELRDDPAIFAYDVFNEPNYRLRRERDGAIWYNQIMPEAIRRIRAINPHIWIAVMPWPWGLAGRFSSMPLIDDPAVLYTFHAYAPHNYTAQGVGEIPRGTVYPGILREYDSEMPRFWDKGALARSMQPALDFARRHDVRMMASEFGVVRWAKGRDTWIADMVSILEDNGIDWLFHTYNTWNGWNPSFAADAEQVGTYPTLFGGVSSPGHRTLLRHWRLNQRF